MKANIFILSTVLLFALSYQTSLNQDSIAVLDSIYPRCFIQDNKTVIYVEEEQALFSTKILVYLAPKGRCSFLALGSAKLEWALPDDPTQPQPIWNYALNYTG